MSNLGYEIKEVSAGLWRRLVDLIEKAQRITAMPALVRSVAAGSALAAMALALPLAISLSPLFAVCVPVALLVGLFPRTRIVTIVLLVTAGAWLVNTVAFEDAPLEAWRIASLGAALYLAHAAATLAAVLPYDSVVGPRVLGRWALRTGAVVVGSVGGGIALWSVLGQLQAVQSIVGPIVGSVIAAALTGLLAWNLRRRA